MFNVSCAVGHTVITQKKTGKTLHGGSSQDVGREGQVQAGLPRGHAGSLPCDTTCRLLPPVWHVLHGPVGFCVASPVLKSKTTVTVGQKQVESAGFGDAPALSESVSSWRHEPPSHTGPRHWGTPPRCTPETAQGQPFPNAVSNFTNLSFLRG